MARPNCIEAFDARRPVAKRDGRRRRLVSPRRATGPSAQVFHGYDIRGILATLGELAGTKSFQYDSIERLTGVSQTYPAPSTQIESYTYDLEGNRIASHISPAYVTDDAIRVLDDGINKYSWSPNGALTTRVPKANSAGALTFWNSWHGYFNQVRLDAIGGALPMHFYYDPLGRMAPRVFDYDATLGVQDRYHDGPDVALEIRNRLSPTPQWARYVHGPGDDQPLALELYPPGAPPTSGTGTQYYYHADGEGSIRLLTDSNGQIADRYDYDYDSYGQRLSVVESAPQPYGWKARDFVPGPNLVFNRARFYDPVLGRFVEEDPIGYTPTH